MFVNFICYSVTCLNTSKTNNQYGQWFVFVQIENCSSLLKMSPALLYK